MAGAPEDWTPEQEARVKTVLRERDYYKLLGLPRTATADDIKREYKKLALQLHPDKCRVPQTDEAFKKVARAFQCLSDPSKRKMYDQFGDDEKQEDGFGAAYAT